MYIRQRLVDRRNIECRTDNLEKCKCYIQLIIDRSSATKGASTRLAGVAETKERVNPTSQ